ncbi:MAG: tetratricopeptide repeat protein [Candidatus Poribacteria bacterium]|nr:tetratricopeptide repeat protein [Candidatus Poribacteria bacterium]
MQNYLDEIKQKIGEIEKKSANGDYIYRGEPRRHRKVSSTLYRQYAKEIEAKNFDIEVAQDKMLEEAKDYVREKDSLEILTQLQHFGGKTNLIDFTTDYLVALFFACDGLPNNNGRVILLQQTEAIRAQIEQPQSRINRVRDQKSIFVRPPRGFLETAQYVTINIPKHLKQPMLNHLRKYHGISTKTIYNDLHGFIRVQNLHQSDYTEFFKGLTYHEKGDYDKAVEHYTEASYLNPLQVGVYYNRGMAFGEIGEVDRAIEEYNKTLQLKPDFAQAYTNRGSAYNDKNEYDRVILDFNKALDLNPDIPEAYAALRIIIEASLTVLLKTTTRQ